MKIRPLSTRRPSALGVPWLFGKNGVNRSICASARKVCSSSPRQFGSLDRAGRVASSRSTGPEPDEFKSFCHRGFPAFVTGGDCHSYAPLGQRPSGCAYRVCGSVPLKAIGTRPEVLAGLKLKPLARPGNFPPNRKRRGSPEQRRSGVQSPKRTWRAVSDVRMDEAKPFENTTISAPRGAPVRVCRRDDGGGGGIRTHGGVPPTSVFKTGALNHSATPPAGATA